MRARSQTLRSSAATDGVAPVIRRRTTGKSLTILVAEDDSNDALLLELAFAEAGVNVPLHFVRDGIEVMDYLQGVPPFDNRAKHPLPDLLLVDLKMPRVDGFEVLAWLRQQPGLSRMTVGVLSGSCWQTDIDRAYALGANFCLNKPLDVRQLTHVVGRMELCRWAQNSLKT